MLSPAASTTALPPVESNETEKISAYYSLAFPNFTYYLQTLTVTIGRRPHPSATSSSTSSDVDVDLGPLKSVSRLHARIEYEEEEERFVLVVLGRNGAWVDGIWAGCGSKVPLGQRYVRLNEIPQSMFMNGLFLHLEKISDSNRNKNVPLYITTASRT